MLCPGARHHAIQRGQAWADEQPPRRRTPEVGFDSLRKGRPAQARLAKALHALARVPEGPWGFRVTYSLNLNLSLLCFHVETVF